jgi:hypothetical protein
VIAPFDMPALAAGFPQRGAWVLRRLGIAFALNDIQAAGPVGNLGYESIGFTKLQEISPLVAGSRGGYGWAQWTSSRRRAFEAWCADHGLDPSSDEANYTYVCVELKGAYAQVVRALRKCDTLEKAVFEFGRLYEAPAGTTSTHLPGFAGRLDYAKQALVAVDAPMAPAPARPLRDGMTGEDVRALQQALLRKGYRVDIDGAFGPRTERAVMDYQRDHQMKVDGLAGPLTLAALNAA